MPPWRRSYPTENSGPASTRPSRHRKPATRRSAATNSNGRSSRTPSPSSATMPPSTPRCRVRETESYADRHAHHQVHRQNNERKVYWDIQKSPQRLSGKSVERTKKSVGRTKKSVGDSRKSSGVKRNDSVARYPGRLPITPSMTLLSPSQTAAAHAVTPYEDQATAFFLIAGQVDMLMLGT